MVGTKQYPINRGKQPVAAVPDNEETPEHMTDIHEPKTPITEPIRLVKTREPNEDDNNAGEGSSSIRDRLQNTPSKERFYKLIRQYKKLEQKNQELKDELTVLLTERVKATNTIKSLKIERDEAIAYYEHAIRARDGLTYQLVNRTSAPIVEAGRKTTKIPDTPILSNSKQVRFETQETVMRQKLEANANHYPLPIYRKLYIQSRYKDKA